MTKNCCLVLRIFALFVVLLPTVICEQVFVKIDDSLDYVSSCKDTISTLTTFFSEASLTLFEATEHKSSFDNIVIQLPTNWVDCGPEVNTSLVLPPEAAQVWIRNRSSGLVWQMEGCGQLGQGVLLQSGVFNTKRDSSLRESVKKSFVSNWLKYFYGLFSEAGQEDNFMFPFYYKNEAEVLPTSCTDKPINGTFTEDCFFDGGPSDNCTMSTGQSQILSSILFSTDLDYFPQILKVCNSSNHNPNAPTQQNLLCNGSSAMDIISSKSRTVKRSLAAPTIIFAQGFTSQFILILDQSLNMVANVSETKNRWDFVRSGLAQIFSILPDNVTKFGVIKSSSPTAVVFYNWTQTTQQLLPSQIFEDVLRPTHTKWSLVAALEAAFVETSRDQSTPKPAILVMTATSIESEDVTSAIQTIRYQNLKLDVVTFSKVQSPTLLKLVHNGNVYAIPESSENPTRMVREVGSAMRQIVTTFGQNLIQDIFSLQIHPSRAQGHFNLTSQTKSNGMIITINSPFDSYKPQMSLTTPNGDELSVENSKLRVIWVQKTQIILADLTDYVPGQWSFNIISPFYEIIYLTVSTNIGNEMRGRSFIESVYKDQPVNTSASVPFKISLFAHLDLSTQIRADDVTVESTICSTSFTCSQLTLRDNGLTVPDITLHDGIFSQYFTKMRQVGFYSTRYQSRIGLDTWRHWVGPSFYVSVPFESDNDIIPPSRITDLRIKTYPSRKEFITLFWTAPGDDFNEGEASYYKIACGLSTDSVTYDGCVDIRETVTFAHQAGTTESINRTIKEEAFDRTLYFGIIALDDQTNESPMSNFAKVFVKGPAPPTTTTVATTTVSSTSTPNSTTTTETSGSNGIQSTSAWSNQTSTVTPSDNSSFPASDISLDNDLFLTTGEFISIVSALGGVLLLLICLVMIYLCLRARKKNIADKLYRDTVAGSSHRPINLANGGTDHHHQHHPHSRHPHHEQRIMSPQHLDGGSGYQLGRGVGDLGSGSLYIDGAGNPIGQSRRGKSATTDYEYRISRIETPPLDLAVRPSSASRLRSRNSRHVAESLSSVSYSTSDDNTDSGHEEVDNRRHFTDRKRNDFTNRSNRAGRANQGYIESPSPDVRHRTPDVRHRLPDVRHRTPVVAKRQLNQNRLIDELSASNLMKNQSQTGNGRSSKRATSGFKVAGNGVLNQNFSNSNFQHPNQQNHFDSPVLTHGKDDSMGSASTAATFQRIDFRPQPTYNPTPNMTRLLDVDGGDQDPKLEMGRAGIRENEPFNYIAFSQQLYGETEAPRARAISFV